MSRLPGRLGRGRTPQVALGAFGKHPAWNDHIDPDIGLDGRLVAFKQLLYLDGVRDRAIPSWLKAGADQLISFGHVFAWETDEDVIVGRLWHSRDGRGRDDFPMVVCAHCIGLPLSWALGTALPLVGRIESSLLRTTDRTAAISAIEQGGADLRALAAHASSDGAPSADPKSIATLVNATEVGEEGLLRVLHVLRDSDFGSPTPTHAEQVRVPRCAASAAEGIRLWSAALETTLGRAPSVLFLAPTEQPWLDLLVGLPDPGQVLSLRSSLKLIPLTTEIAYTIDEAFASPKRALLRQARAIAGTLPT